MMASLFAGVSGLKNHQVKMNVVGDNIANVNTVGFKLGRVTFQESLVQTLRGAARPTSTQGGSNPLQLGLGMSLNTIDNIFLQGGLETTGQITDLAIQGGGFFVLSNGQQDFYTRAGAFSFDADSNMVNPGNGYILQGKMADVDGTIPANASVGNIMLPFGQQDPARATEEIILGMNLNSNATESEASLVSSGGTNVTTVSGYAENGAGGTHTVTVVGNNAEYSQLGGAHRNVLTDVAGATATPGVVGASTLPAGGYVYMVVAVNELGQSIGAEIGTDAAPINVVAGESVLIDWTAYVDADADQVWIYRRAAGGQYTDANNGLISQVNYADGTYRDSGDQAAPSNPPSINTTENLTGTELLSSLGITDVSDFQVCVDSGTWVTLTQLTLTSTVNDLISAINSNAPGVTASIQNGEVHLKRDYAGAPSTFNVAIRDQGVTDICQQIFDAATFTVNNGSASTLVATDIFTPDITGVAISPVTLTLVTDTNTGKITGISDLGGGGVTVSASNGLNAGTLMIDTEETQHASSITIYDSQGGKHTMTITFTKSWNNNEWFWEIETTGNEQIRSGGSGNISFNSDGSLAAFNFDGGATSLIIDPNNGSENLNIDLEAGSPGGFDGLTGFAASSTAAARSQDGYGLGVLSNISIDTSGTITGMFTNGVSRILAQIYIAEFNNPAGLLKNGKNMYQTSANSGNAILGIPNTTSSSTITSGALEISNVDLAQEFTGMIVAQRGFQANARVITTSDEMLNELVALKR